MTAVATLPVVLQEGTHAARPAASAVGSGALYFCTTHSLIYQQIGGAWGTFWTFSAGFADPMTSRGDIIVRNASNVTARLAKGGAGTFLGSDGTDVAYGSVTDALLSTSDITTNNASTSKHGFAPKYPNDATKYLDGTGAYSVPAGAGTSDPIADMFGTPDSAFEFASSSLSGLTALSPTPDVENANTSVPGAYYVADNAGGTSWCGRYVAATAPCTAIIQVLGFTGKQNYNALGVFVGVTTPGKFVITRLANADRKLGCEIFTNPTTYSSTPTDAITQYNGIPFYLAVCATSDTSVAYYGSPDGHVWYPIQTGHNPSLTIGSIGFGMKSENSAGAAAAIGFFRVWNSAKTFLTGA